jgi:DNA-binding XRE family transcriptional regulator
MPTPTGKELKEAAARAADWKEFRKIYLFSQSDLARTLGCSRRTVVAIEGAAVMSPRFSLLRRFRDLKRKMENGELRWA